MVVRGMILAHTFPVALTTAPVTFNQDIKALVPGSAWSADYLFYWLQSKAPEVLRLVDVANHGTKRLPSERLFALEVLRPPLLEQRKIAAILTSVDDAIEASQAVIDQLGVVKKAMMAELLTRGLPGRHTRFKQTEIGEVPEEWEVVPLATCIEPDRPVCYGILMPGKGYAGGVPVVKVKDIKNGAIDERDILLTSPELDEQYRRSRLREGDVLLTIRGTTGRVARVPQTLERANITQDTARLTISAEINQDFLYYALQGPSLQQQIQDHTRGQAVKGINIGDVRKLQVPLPTRSEQEGIARALAFIDECHRANRRELEESRRVKSALMSVLLTGEVRVTPDESL